MKKVIIILLVLTGIWLGLRFIIGGLEDSWICADGEWVKHGAPSAPMPDEPCGEKPIACAMDAKLCPDGSYVGRTGPECEFSACPKKNLIRIFSPQANQTISSPLLIKGEARGLWFFEASFPVRLYDGEGNKIGLAVAQAKGDWMTENFVPFGTELIFASPKTAAGTLVFEKDNPSGLPENADELRVPVFFSSEKIKARSVKLFYYNPEKDKDENGNIKCSRDGLTPIEREIPITPTPIQDTINLLFSGKLTNEERAEGIKTEYPLEGFLLKGAVLKNGVLTLEFEDLKNKTVGGSCRVGILWFQIEATAKQFEDVKEVRFYPPELFQP